MNHATINLFKDFGLIILGGILSIVGGFFQAWYTNKKSNQEYFRNKKSQMYEYAVELYHKAGTYKNDDEYLKEIIKCFF